MREDAMIKKGQGGDKETAGRDAPLLDARAPGAAARRAMADARRLSRWRAYLAKRGRTVPDREDFASFGKLSTLERLHRALATIAPAQCGPLAAVIRDLKREKRARQGRGGQRGPARTLSVAAGELRPDWRATLDRLGRERAGLDQGMVHLGDLPPAPSQLRCTAYALRSLAGACRDASVPCEVTIATVTLWLGREEARGRRDTGLAHQLRKMAEFLRHHDGGSGRAGRKEARRTAKALERQAGRFARWGRLVRKRKHQWLLEHPTDLHRVWDLAEDLLAQSHAAKPGSARRRRRALHAAALALAVNAPLRIGDLHRLRVGREISRDTTGWSIRIRTAKTQHDYELSELWPELTPFLDTLVVLEAPGGDLWAGYDQREGTPLFSDDGGTTALTGDWISDVWYEHVGTGAHIVRTLWHEAVLDVDPADGVARDRTWLALALCGQRSRRTRKEYSESAASVGAVRMGRAMLRRRRDAARVEAMREEGGPPSARG